MAVANKLVGKPVVLIAVNSGNSRSKVQSYANKHGITMPIIVDTDRSFEKQLPVSEISLRNIWAAATLNGDGRVTRGGAQDLEAAATRALAGAAWNVDPDGIPATLQASWQSIEFGNYAAGAPMVKKGLKSRKPAMKAAAQRLSDYVQSLIQDRLDLAGDALEEGNEYQAFLLFSSVATKFKGFDLPKDLAQKVRKMQSDPTIKKELSAQRRLSTAMKALSSTSSSAKQRARKILGSLVKTAGDTSAGKEAKSLLEQMGQ